MKTREKVRRMVNTVIAIMLICIFTVNGVTELKAGTQGIGVGFINVGRVPDNFKKLKDTAKDKTTLKSISGEKVYINSMNNKNGSGDCTYIRVEDEGGKERYVVIDAGCATNNYESIRSLEGTNIYKKGKWKIHHFILTHLHGDHIKGLVYLTKKADAGEKIVINNMYINTLFSNQVVDSGKGTTAKDIIVTFLNHKNVSVEKINYTSESDWEKISKKIKNKKITAKIIKEPLKVSLGSSQCGMVILPPIKKFDTQGSNEAENINNSCMIVTLRDTNASSNKKSFKVIFPGDLEEGALGLITKLEKCEDKDINARINNIRYYLSGDEDSNVSNNNNNYNKVYYKLSHHGKRYNSYMYGTKLSKREVLMFQLMKPNYLIGTDWVGEPAHMEYFHCGIINQAHENVVKAESQGKTFDITAFQRTIYLSSGF